ncbi:hypothetical protein [Chondrinema litorale]|uniref:hypothetical protein n=1 Tax=Chondrinema litorale TaxID=2994555 RepID=UPI002543C059|nr:hypothetical protein [Chondrinema litorale]UZS00288.1 hypothetical protein OQ292_40820 [Chondrinema litorale]
MSWLGLVNYYFLQWFFIRLTKHQEKRAVEYELIELSFFPNNQFVTGGNAKMETWQWYSIQGWVLPTSGWSTNFKYLNKSKKPFFIKITKPNKLIKVY